VIFSWLRKRRRRKWTSRPFPEAWRAHIADNVPLWKGLTPEEKAKLAGVVQVLLPEKTWEGCGGLEVTDEMRVTIAAQASLLVLGFSPTYYFDEVQSIVVYPGAYKHPREWERDSGVLGEAWQGGPIVLSWDSVVQQARNPQDGFNLVLHEFAHHLDSLNGDMDGVPPLVGGKTIDEWHRVTQEAFERLQERTHARKVTVLDSYGATNPEEFFAVASECFFERAIKLRARQPELYRVLSGFYNQDPAAREEGRRRER